MSTTHSLFGRFQATWQEPLADQAKPEFKGFELRDRLCPSQVWHVPLPHSASAETVFHTFFTEHYNPGPVGVVAMAALAQHPMLQWQMPCNTEGSAFDAHKGMVKPVVHNGAVQVYVGLPWATWIDRLNKSTATAECKQHMQTQLQLCRSQLLTLKRALASVGLGLHVHTVCQHIYWQHMVNAFVQLGVSHVWLSHCTQQVVAERLAGLHYGPWRLFAVNVEDPSRTAGLTLSLRAGQRPILASFTGAHMPHYLSDVRLRLLALQHQPGFEIAVNDEWHFEQAVYANGVNQNHADSVQTYNQQLSQSVFALCPAGSGPNTLRLWEALAVGSIPVLLGDEPLLPTIPERITMVDWDAAVVRCAVQDIPQLPQRLNAMPQSERAQRQANCQALFKAVQHMRCF